MIDRRSKIVFSAVVALVILVGAVAWVNRLDFPVEEQSINESVDVTDSLQFEYEEPDIPSSQAISSSVPAPNKDVDQPLVIAADSDAVSRLSPWVDDVYFATGRQPHHLRDRILRVDKERILSAIRGTDVAETETGVLHPQTELKLDLFSDNPLIVKITDLSTGNTGAVSAWGHVQNSDQSTARIFINSRGKIKGSFSTRDRDYRLIATPELPYYLVLEMVARDTTDTVGE